jgi:hypothetical protein
MKKEVEKLHALLPHWIEHNLEHVRSFQEWAERARSAGEAELAAQIAEAAEKMAAANRDLERALEQIAPSSEATHPTHSH